MSGRGVSAGGAASAGAGVRGAGLGRLGVRGAGIATGRGAAALLGEVAGFFRVALSAAFTWFFKALAAAFASLRMRFASFLACLKAFRTSFNLALACRANLRAVSACFSA